MTKEELKSSLESFFVSKYGLPKNQHLPLNFDLMLSSVISQAIAEHEAAQWYYKKPRSNDKNLWGKDVLVERKNYVGDNYFSIDIMPLSGNIIRWRELPEPYQEGGER